MSNINQNVVMLVGANGQLGSLIKDSVPAEYSLKAYASSELDITNAKAVVKIIDELKPAIIINAAAYTLVDKAEEEREKAFAVNAQGPKNIAKAASKSTRIIHVSTDFVFDGTSERPYQTDDEANPLGVYGESKLAGERALLEIAPENSVIIRTAWLYSAKGKNFVNTMLFLMNNKDELSVVGDQRGTPTNAATLARVIWEVAAKTNVAGIYHWTDQGETTWYEFACAIQALGLELNIIKKAIEINPISTEEYPTPAVRPAYSVLDKETMYKAINFEGKPWQQELRDVLSVL